MAVIITPDHTTKRGDDWVSSIPYTYLAGDEEQDLSDTDRWLVEGQLRLKDKDPTIAAIFEFDETNLPSSLCVPKLGREATGILLPGKTYAGDIQVTDLTGPYGRKSTPGSSSGLDATATRFSSPVPKPVTDLSDYATITYVDAAVAGVVGGVRLVLAEDLTAAATLNTSDASFEIPTIHAVFELTSAEAHTGQVDLTVADVEDYQFRMFNLRIINSAYPASDGWTLAGADHNPDPRAGYTTTYLVTAYGDPDTHTTRVFAIRLAVIPPVMWQPLPPAIPSNSLNSADFTPDGDGAITVPIDPTVSVTSLYIGSEFSHVYFVVGNPGPGLFGQRNLVIADFAGTGTPTPISIANTTSGTPMGQTKANAQTLYRIDVYGGPTDPVVVQGARLLQQ